MRRSPSTKTRRRFAEAWGPYRAKGHVDQSSREGMLPSNFENAHKVLFSTALDAVIDEFVAAATEINEEMCGFEEDEACDAAMEAEALGEELREELLLKISSKLMKYAEEYGM